MCDGVSETKGSYMSTNTDSRNALIDGARQMLDFLEANPAVALPGLVGRGMLYAWSREDFIATAHAIGAEGVEQRGRDVVAFRRFGEAELLVKAEGRCFDPTLPDVPQVALPSLDEIHAPADVDAAAVV